MPKLFSELRRLRRLHSVSSSPLILFRSIHSQSPNPIFSPLNNYSKLRENSQSRFNPTDTSHAFANFVSLRSLSVHSPTNSFEDEGNIFDVHSNSESELLNLGFNGGSEVAEGVVSGSEWYDPLVSTVMSVLDGYHDLTGLPWWIIIASSTLALRIALVPLLILQLKKLKRFSELFPKLPPPFPPPLSGKGYIKQYLLFRKEKQAIGCPSALWGLATVSVQVPCFLLWMTSIRKMSMDHHPGFDCGGMLWFQNLTETPHGFLGPIFPVLIAGLHFINVQISFQMARSGKVTGVLGMLAKYYKLYLDILTLPLCLIGFCIPQGSLVYWLTNSSITLVQNLSLRHPSIREKLGLPDMNSMKRGETTNVSTPEISIMGTEMERKVSVQNLSPDELLPLSVQFLARGNKDRAIPLLRLALKKDPEYVRALVLLGQALMQQEMTEAMECFERAITKLLYVGHPTKDEDVDLLILASTWAGVTSVKQGKIVAGLEHLQRVAEIKEPEDPPGKAHYFDGLVMLASALFSEGRKDEAEKLLRRATAYNYDAYNVYLQQCVEDSDNIDTVSDQKNQFAKRKQPVK